MRRNIVEWKSQMSSFEKGARDAAKRALIEFVRAMAREHARRDYAEEVNRRRRHKGGRPKKHSLTPKST